MKLKRYNQFITEAVSEDLSKKITDKFKDIKIDLLELITKSINSETLDLITSFLKDYTKEESKSNIDGLVNDSDIYDFYTKYTNDVDEIIEKNNQLGTSPKDLDTFGLYDYVVKQTKIAIKELSKDLLSDLESDVNQQNESLMFWKNKKDKKVGKVVLVPNKIGSNVDFVYQLLEKKEGNFYKAVLIGDLKMNRTPKFELWLNLEKKLGTKKIKKHFIFEDIDNWSEPNIEQKKILVEAFVKLEKYFDDFITIEDKIKKITGEKPIV